MADDTLRPEAERPEFLGFRFDPIDMDQTMAMLRGRAAGAPFAYVVTPNVDHAVRFDRCREKLGPAYRAAWLTLCDSRILARLAGMAGMALPVVAGSDLTAAVLRDAVEAGDRIAILGGRAADIAVLRSELAQIEIVHHDPPMGFIDDPAERAKAARFIAEARARFTFLAVGSPRQELVAHDVLQTGQAGGIGLCIGASIEFLTGSQKRAPVIVQRLHLEWLFRLLSDPKRLWRRYLVEGPAIFSIFRRWQRERRRSA